MLLSPVTIPPFGFLSFSPSAQLVLDFSCPKNAHGIHASINECGQPLDTVTSIHNTQCPLSQAQSATYGRYTESRKTPESVLSMLCLKKSTAVRPNGNRRGRGEVDLPGRSTGFSCSRQTRYPGPKSIFNSRTPSPTGSQLDRFPASILLSRTRMTFRPTASRNPLIPRIEWIPSLAVR